MRRRSKSSAERPSCWRIMIEYLARRADGRADAHAKEVAENNGGRADHQNECEGLAIQFFDPGIVASLFQATLSDDGPSQIGNSAVGADQLGLMSLLDIDEALHG